MLNFSSVAPARILFQKLQNWKLQCFTASDAYASNLMNL